MKLTKYIALLASAGCILGASSLLRAADDAAPGAGKPKKHERAPVLTKEEREKIKAAREAAHQDPAFKAAREKAKESKKPEDFKAAREAFRAAMIKADPSVEAILAKHPRAALPMIPRRGPPPGKREDKGGKDKGNGEEPPPPPSEK